MRFQHFTREKLVFDPTIQYIIPENEGYFKPTGFWVSVAGEDDWKDWCTREEFREDSLTHVSEFDIDLSNVLVLTTMEQILQFGRDYVHEIVKTKWINWPKVAVDYDGIIIAPYCWPLRYRDDTHWYYTWDCASGCIWNLSIMKEKS